MWSLVMPLRREPVQQRSKERVERILAAAADLLAEGGPDALKPTEVARRAGVPVGSVYQYFEDKAAILDVLVERYFERTTAALTASLLSRGSLEELAEGLLEAIEDWYRMHQEEPFWRQVLFGMLTDTTLQARNIEDSRRTAQVLADAVLARVDTDREALERRVLVLDHLVVAALQLALAQPSRAEQDAVFAVYVDIARREMERLWTEV
jgi:AcrR family transcriptional regulator